MNDPEWTQQDLDRLLDLWFRGEHKKKIADKLNRSIDSIASQVWKVTTGYRDFLDYQPKNRIWRQGFLNRRERKAIMSGLMGEGKQRGVSIEHLAKVMSREPEELERQINQAGLLQERGEGFGAMR